MHKDLSEWYRLAGMDPNGEILPKRGTAINNYEPSSGDVVSLVRLFYRLGQPNDDFLAAFRESFQKTDPTFKMRDNDLELSVLAGAQLIEVIELHSLDLVNLAALGLVSAAASNLRPGPSVREIPEIAARHLSKQAVSRALVDEGDTDAGPNKAMFDALTALGSPHIELVKELQRLQRQLSIVEEESNMLWWLFSEHSRDQQKRWKDFPVPAVALMAGKELADLTTIIPGPIAAAAFLDRVIRCAESAPPTAVLIRDAINKVTIEWRQQYAKGGCPSELEDLLPISHGIRLSLQSPEENAWLPAFARGTAIPSDASIAPHILAYQIFLEALLCRSWKQLK